MARRMNGDGTIVETVKKVKDKKTGEVKSKKYFRGALPRGNGKRKWFGAYTRQEVRRKMIDWRRRHPLVQKGKPTQFGDWYLYWVDTYKAKEVQATTLEGYLVAYEKHIQGTRLDGTYLEDIDLELLQEFYKSKEPDYTANQVHRLYVKINAALETARMHDYIFKNYSKGVTLRKVETVKSENAYRVFSKEEQGRFMSELDPSCNVLDAVIYFTLYTGLRLGEVLALRWDDYDGDEITVDEQYQRSTVFNDDGSRKTVYVFKKVMKTTSSKRSVPVPKPAKDLLEVLAVQRHGKNPEELIFNIDGDPVERKRPDRRVKSICRRIGLLERNFHSLRHTYATRLFEQSVEPKTVQSLLGHSSMKMTMDIYTHVMKSSKHKALEALENLDF